ncbi:MAG: hypothetical protein AAFY72_05680 [Cyanobacteria bacterium J06649_4]
MTATSSQTRYTAKARPQKSRRRKVCWLDFFLALSPFITLTSLGVSGASVLQGLDTSPTVTENIIKPFSALPQEKNERNDVLIANSDLATVNNLASQHNETNKIAVELLPAEFYQLLTLSILEATTPTGRLDIIQAVFNRLNAPKVGLGHYGDTITDIAFAPGQFEPYFHISPDEIVDFESAIAILIQERKYTPTQAKAALEQVITDVTNLKQMTHARTHVGGRTAFKGTTQYAYRVTSEDPLRTNGENFFHIEKGQTYQQLTQLETLGPVHVELASHQ